MPSAEVEVTVELVAALLESQHPDLAGLELRVVANGWDNMIVRLGTDMAVRMPRRGVAAVLVEHEQRWLPELARRLPIPIPAPIRVGRPEFGYPWLWSVTPWFEGEVAADAVLLDPAREALRLGGFMSALHDAAPPDAPRNPFRDGFIGDRRERFATSLELVSDVLDELVPSGGARAWECWSDLVATPPFPGPPAWVAGDVHSANVVVTDGEIAAVIDFGDLCGGDPAVDLAIAWMLFGPDERTVFREAASRGTVPVDEPMWRRAEAWAWYFAVIYLANSADAPRMNRIGRRLALALYGSSR